MKSLRDHAHVMKMGTISKRHQEERGGQSMAVGSQSGYIPESQQEPIGNIRENGMRYAGRLADGKEVVHTPILVDVIHLVGLTFKEASTANKLDNKIFDYPEGALGLPNEDELKIIGSSYSEEERKRIGKVWSQHEADGLVLMHRFQDGKRIWALPEARATSCLVPK